MDVQATSATAQTRTHDRYIDAIRAGALLAVVFGHWVATLPRTVGTRVVGTDHLLHLWSPAAAITWVWQVVPLFVFVSAAVATPSAARILDGQQRLPSWWAGRALRLFRPTLTYVATIAGLALLGLLLTPLGRTMRVFDASLTVHLWFLVMLLAVQLLLPVAVAAHRRHGLLAIAGLVVGVAVVDVVRALFSPLSAGPGDLGALVVTSPRGIGLPNMLLAWLVPQQLGVAWASGRYGGPRAGGVMVLLGAAWLAVTTSLGYPIAVIGGDLETGSNVLPPTFALLGVMWLQAGVALLVERPARRLLDRRRVWAIVRWLGVIGMPLYLWHKLAEVPAAAMAAWTGWEIDAGDPGDVGFWVGRGWWLLWCAVAVMPIMAGVVAFELRRSRTVEPATSPRVVAAAGLAGAAGLIVAIALGALPGAVIGVLGIAVASRTLRQRGAGLTAPA